MEGGKELVKAMHPGNLIEELQNKVKSADSAIKKWLRVQSAPVEVALTTAMSAVQGGAIGALMGTLTGDLSSSLPAQPPGGNPQAMASLQRAQAFAGGPLVQARNFAVMTGVNAGITCAMKRARGGVEDVQTSMVAAFGSGAVFTLVSGMAGPNPAVNAATSGLFFALIQGGLFTLGQKFSQPSPEENYYAETKTMLSKLGLQNYEKNFRKGLLTDNTLPLLTDSALRDVKIPPGPRLLILDHIQRDPEVKWRGNQ
uniref:TSA: Wollemia nobilis Ref_Wollemi_Transcript_16138_1217 transcribed RNA sequence n=1 Tax=Wollemia nobilis TaxID=56998 RepID=A0A0C9S2Z5_9CONI